MNGQRGVVGLSVFELLVFALVLSMDAFAAAVCKGLAVGRSIKYKYCIWTGLWFGTFQALMPTVGYFCARLLYTFAGGFSKFISSFLLVFLGINMLRDAFGESQSENADMSVKEMFILAVATSIDALSAGVSMAMMQNVPVFYVVLMTGLITFALSAAGVKIGGIAGTKYNSFATAAAGCVLILLGLKTLL